MPNWAVQIIIGILVIVGLVIVINALGDAGAFN